MNARLLKLPEAAAYCGLKPRYFRRQIGIPPIRLGSHELWDKNKLDAYIDALQGQPAKPEEIDWSDAAKRF